MILCQLRRDTKPILAQNAHIGLHDSGPFSEKELHAVTTRRKTGKIAFRPRARLLKLIGEELISDEVVAVSELVKNAHDADAKEVVITFRGVTTEVGEIEIRDDGIGMNLETLLTRWMEPAASTKTGKGRQVTR